MPKDRDRDRERIGKWANAAAEREFLELHAALEQEHREALCAQGWGPPHERDIATTYGWTRVSQWGGAGPPLVLLGGAGAPSLMWVPLLHELVGCSVYVVDVLGEPGRSVQRVPLRDGADVAAWLEEVLAGLHLDTATLVGASYGGWIALAHARQFPRRVEHVVLLEPALVRPRPLFWVHGIACGIALFMPGPVRRRAAGPLRMQLLAADDKRVRRMGVLGQTKFRRGMPRFEAVTDDELAAVTQPTLALFAAKSQLHHARQLCERVRAVMPYVDAELIPRAGHSLPVDHAVEVGARIRVFTTPSPAR
jgi:pimeloyl-ACP methyl ester carboxylesterase